MHVYIAHSRLEIELGAKYTDFLRREGFTVFNPLDGSIDQSLPMKELMLTEMGIIAKQDCLIALITEKPNRSSNMEAFYAWEKGLPVITVWLVPDGRKSWYDAFATIVFDSNELLEALRKLEQ